MQNQLAASVVWVSQDDISSEFDVPYAPVTQNSDIKKLPYPGGLGQRIKYALRPSVPVAVFPYHGTKVRPRSLWDRVVFVWFCGCLVILSYTLAGFGYSGHDHATCALFATSSHAPTSAHTDMKAASSSSVEGIIGRGMDRERPDGVENGSLMKDPRAVLESSHAPDPTTKPLVSNSEPTATSIEHPLDSPLKQRGAQPLMANLPPFRHLPGNDPFDLESFFDGGGYGNDGQPFALKVHIPQDGSQSHVIYRGNSKRSRESGRC